MREVVSEVLRYEVEGAETVISKVFSMETAVVKLDNTTKRSGVAFGRAFDSINRRVFQFTRAINQFRRAYEAINFVIRGFQLLASPIVKATQLATGFEHELARVSTLLDDTGQQLESVASSAHRLANIFGRGAKEQVQAFYVALSAGARSASEATALVENANKLALGGSADLKASIAGLTTVVQAYNVSFDKAAIVADQFFVAAKIGKTSVEELSVNIGKAAGNAALAEVSTGELAAAMAVLSNVGIKTDEAAVAINQMLVALMTNAPKARKEAERLGIEFNIAALQSKGLVRFLKEIVSSGDLTNESIQALFGNVRAMRAVLGLSRGDLEIFDQAINDVKNSIGAADEATRKMSSTLKFQEERYDAVSESASIAFGTMLAKSSSVIGSLRILNNLIEDLSVVMQKAGESGSGLFANIATGIALAPMPGIRALLPVFEFFRRAGKDQEAFTAQTEELARTLRQISIISKEMVDLERTHSKVFPGEDVTDIARYRDLAATYNVLSDAARKLGASQETVAEAFRRGAMGSDILGSPTKRPTGDGGDKEAAKALQRRIDEFLNTLRNTRRTTDSQMFDMERGLVNAVDNFWDAIGKASSGSSFNEAVKRAYDARQSVEKVFEESEDALTLLARRKAASQQAIIDLEEELAANRTGAALEHAKQQRSLELENIESDDQQTKAMVDKIRERGESYREAIREEEEATRKLTEELRKIIVGDRRSFSTDPMEFVGQAQEMRARRDRMMSGISGQIADEGDPARKSGLEKKRELMRGIFDEEAAKLHEAAVEKMIRANRELRASFVSVATTMAVDVADALMSMNDGTEAAREAWKTVAKVMVRAVLQMIQALITYAVEAQAANIAVASSEAIKTGVTVGGDAGAQAGWPAALAIIPAVTGAVIGILMAFVNRMASGGIVSGGQRGMDSVMAMLEPGEFVLPSDVVEDIRKGRPPGMFSAGRTSGEDDVEYGSRGNNVNVTFAPTITAQAMPNTEQNLSMLHNGLLRGVGELARRGIEIRPARLYGRGRKER